MSGVEVKEKRTSQEIEAFNIYMEAVVKANEPKIREYVI